VVNIDPMSKVMSLKTVLAVIIEKTQRGGNTATNIRNLRKELINTVVYTR
jgi:hypothetical protein